MRLRVLVVDDSITIRRILAEIVRDHPDLELVGEAENGAVAFEICRRERPDVVSLDIAMPVVNGLQATERIMAHCPTPILIVSASANRADLYRTYDALTAGAIDVLEKPMDEPQETWIELYVRMLKMVASIKVITHSRGLHRGVLDKPATAIGIPEIVAIGASTGGPRAVVRLLRGLPSDFPIPIVLVLHVDAPFDTYLADWLGRETPLSVTTAEPGTEIATLRPGATVLAPGGRHLVVQGGRLQTSAAPPRHFCRPSVDVLFESVAREYGGVGAGVLLTGMGRDGAAGLLAIAKAGGYAFAQNEATSTVFGMPKAAVEIGAVKETYSPEEISALLVQISE